MTLLGLGVAEQFHMLLRDAVSALPDRSFARRVAIATGITTAVALGGAVAVLVYSNTPRELPLPQVATITIPSVEATHRFIHLELEPALALAQQELDTYARDAFWRWEAANGHPLIECPGQLVDMNRFVPALHVVDPWGTSYEFFCGKNYGFEGISIRSAGPDLKFGTNDDLASR